MGFIKECVTDINKLFDIDDMVLSVSRGGTVFQDESDILSNIIKFNQRATIVSVVNTIRFNFRCKNYDIISFQISEYPHCCGHAILHMIMILDRIHILSDKKIISSDTYAEVIKRILKFVEDCLSRMRYSSYSFILSDVDNKDLYDIVHRYDILKEQVEFKNRRNSYKHTCKLYFFTLEPVDPQEDERNYKKEISAGTGAF